jgi:hypothetical protein
VILEGHDRFFVVQGCSNPDRQIACGAHSVVRVEVDSLLLFGREIHEHHVVNPERLRNVSIEDHVGIIEVQEALVLELVCKLLQALPAGEPGWRVGHLPPETQCVKVGGEDGSRQWNICEVVDVKWPVS